MNATDELEKAMRDIQRKAYADGWRAGLSAAQETLAKIGNHPLTYLMTRLDE